MQQQRVFRGDAAESAFGFCQAVRTGPFIHISGMTGRHPSGHIVGLDDAAAQAEQALQNLQRTLNECDADLTDVVRTRLFLTRREDAAAIAAVHQKYFSASPPAATLVIVAGLFEPELLIEIEADVLVADAL